jgi:CotH kinase protein/Lamin Tail Domain/Chitobiase/beta-hexosaminidase C-terminal domain/CHU_C Type IX secretion signal domain
MAKLLLFTLLISAHTLSAQVVINEISAANLNGILDGDGDREDWVELHNTGAVAVNISGWFLSDNPGNPQKWVVPNGQTIAAGGYKMVYCSGKNKVAGATVHTNFKLSQTKGESVLLSQPSGTLVDSYTFSIPNQGDQSYGRSPNGSANWRIFFTPTPNAANITSAYTAYAPNVIATLDGGFYPGTISVGLSTSAGFSIRYTTNGTEPTTTSPLYATPVNIPITTVLKARAFSANGQILPGFVLANTYFITVTHTIPVISIAGDNIATLMSGNHVRPFGSFEYYENQALADEAYGEFNKHGNDSWAYNQRGIDWITRDQMGYKDELKYKFFEERKRTKFQRLILKAAANDNYPAQNGGAHIRDSYVHTLAIRGGLDVDSRTHKSCILYVNGAYWGVYDMREKVDDSDFTDYYYDQDEPFIDYIKTWGATWLEYGSGTDWYALKAFILGNDMTVPANYDFVKQQFDLQSLVDYIIINQHSVCKDWLNWNTAWWRGRDPNGDAKKWRYTLWDMDATFGHYINYTGIPTTTAFADPCDVEQIPNSGDPQNHIDILMALFNNPEFKALYINRYADLLNTSLSCEYMIALLDSMTNTIAPEMAQQCARWGGTVAGWNNNVQKIRDFINARCQVIDNGVVDCYDVTGPFQLTVKVSPVGSPNNVKVNTITPAAYPYLGDYFGGVNIDLKAKPGTGWLFDHWEVNGNVFAPDQFAAAILLAFEQTGDVTAFFVPLAPCTEPADLVLSENSTTQTVIDWTGPVSASSYHIRYRKVGTPVWTDLNTPTPKGQFDSLPGCTDYEMQVRTFCPHDTSDYVDFLFSTPDHLMGFGLPDATICNTNTAVLDASVSGATYLWDDASTTPTRSVNSPGTYWVSVKVGECVLTDSVLVSQINASVNLQPVLCPGETYLVGTSLFNQGNPNGQVVLANAGVNGCDSIINVSLQYLSISQTQLSQTSCDPQAVGQDTVLLQNAVGCDSLVITTTSLVLSSQTNLAASSCNPNLVGTDTLLLSNQFGCDSLVITTTTFDASAVSITPLSAGSCDPMAVGQDTVFLLSVAGCDSLVITTTSLVPFSQTALSASSCNPNLIGIDTLVLSNYFGCDSLVITTTTFDASAIPFTNLFVKNCDPNQVGIDTTVLLSAAGCDSLVIVNTSLAPMSQTSLSAQSCNPNLIGIDTLVLSNHFGCDSLVITNTTFDASAIPFTNLFVKNCDPNQVGIDTTILLSAAGCDSLVITNTSLAPMSQTSLNAKSCNPNLIGIDTLVLSNYFGCDSLVITTTSFDVSAIPITNLFVKNCDPSQVGIDTSILLSAVGCDSLVITSTSLAPMSQTALTAKTCDQNQVGIDTLVLSNYYGCDSLVITDVRYVGLEMLASSPKVLCFEARDGMVLIDSILTAYLPVEIELQSQPAKLYNGSPISWTGLSSGTYSLMATNTEGCSITQDVEVFESDPLLLDLGLQQVSLHYGDSVWVEPMADFQIAVAAWLPVEGVDCPSCPATYIFAENTGEYTLTVFDPNGCSVSASLQMKVDKGVRLFVPNAIHLGQTGPNAQLSVFVGPEVLRIPSLQVFDRWGNKIFEQKDLPPNSPSNWDGTYRGQLVNPGVYVWSCSLETISGETVHMSGDFTIIR